MEWPILTNKKEVQLFLGFTNFYRRFIEGFSQLAHPLFDLTKVDSTFHWSMKEQLAFDTLRERITSDPILALPDNSRPYHVEADSSDFATGAVLSQQCPEVDKWHPVVFLSKSLSPVEKNKLLTCAYGTESQLASQGGGLRPEVNIGPNKQINNMSWEHNWITDPNIQHNC